MKNNRLLIIGITLIAFGLVGIITIYSADSYQRTNGGWMPTMMNMMGGGMMDGDMMNQDHMKEMMQRMMPGMLPPGIKPEDLPEPMSRGAGLVVRHCTQCHYLPSPSMHSAEEWPAVANRMFSRISMMGRGMIGRGMMGIESLSIDEQKTIVAYLKRHSMKSVSPGSLPSPESQGAVLFKNRCALCHPLPDPKLHTAEEWPMVVERMRGHTQTTGKGSITDQDNKEIVSYLINHARK